MRRDPRTYLWDALRATELLAEFSSGKSFRDIFIRGYATARRARLSTVVYSD